MIRNALNGRLTLKISIVSAASAAFDLAEKGRDEGILKQTFAARERPDRHFPRHLADYPITLERNRRNQAVPPNGGEEFHQFTLSRARYSRVVISSNARCGRKENDRREI